jgi:hypothetical protein
MKKIIYLSLCAVVSMLSACTYDEDIEEIRQEIEEIKATQKALQDAYNAGKLITDVSPKGELNDWLITFSDNTSITINSGRDGENGVDGINGTDGVTPYLKIDENKCWTVSYDNGETFVPLLDKNSNPIVAVGKDGEQGPQGPQGPQGEAGRDGYSVRVVTNDQGYYAFEIYNPTTSEVVETVETQYSSNPKNIIKSIVEDTKDNVIITMESGEVYVFKKGDISNPMKLLCFKFLAENNPRNLLKDVNFEISADNEVSSFISYILENRKFIPTYETTYGVLMLGDEEVVSGETELDCSLPLELKLVSEDETLTYKLSIRYFTGLPIVYINTEDKKPIESKDEYVKGSVRIVSNNVNGVPDFESAMKIKGRGNSTWNFAKKPYKMKFDSKVSLLGEPEDKEWVLLANYTDKTQIRNEIAFFMGELSSLDYTPRTHYVEVVLNGIYNGTYQLCEQLKISKSRVNVGDDGYLLEADMKAAADDVTFKVTHISQRLNIKDPEVEVDSEAYTYVVNHLNYIDEVLFSDNFADPVEGYAKYMDVLSFVDWYLINEITKNPDSRFDTSCYMHLSRGGKLTMGPLWDYDIACGNINYHVLAADPEGFWVKSVPWYVRLFEDPAFVSLVKERFAYFYGKQNEIFAEINRNAEYLQYAAVENNNKWGTLYNYTWPNNEILGTYQSEVQNMKNWLIRRFEWLNTAISEL